MDLNDLFNMLWGKDGMNPFGNPDRLRQYFEEQELEEEHCEFIKGNVKTNITYQFNKKGYLVSQSVVCKLIGGEDKEELQRQLDEALEKEDYIKAAMIKKQIDDSDKREGEEGSNKQ